MEHPPYLKAEEKFLRLGWLTLLDSADEIEKLATWILTGVAATVALLIANASSVLQLVSNSSFKMGIVLFLASIACGLVAKERGISIRVGNALLKQMYSELISEEGRAMLAAMRQEQLPATCVADKFAQPFLWPISAVVRKGAMRGSQGNPLNSEHRLVRRWCWMTFAAFAQSIFAVLAIGALILGMKQA